MSFRTSAHLRRVLLRKNEHIHKSKNSCSDPCVDGPLPRTLAPHVGGTTMFGRTVARCVLSVVALGPRARAPMALAARLAPRAGTTCVPGGVRACSSEGQASEDETPVTDSDTAAQFKKIFTESQELSHVRGLCCVWRMFPAPPSRTRSCRSRACFVNRCNWSTARPWLCTNAHISLVRCLWARGSGS